MQNVNQIKAMLTDQSNYLITLVQGVFEMRAQTLTTSYWPHAELGKNTQTIPSKNKTS
jgi:hypothetical protein